MGLLQACGGGGDDDAAPRAAVVAPATAVSLPVSGERRSTGAGLDAAIDGAGAFVLIDPATAALVYSRLGHFNIDSEGLLVNGDGLHVGGIPPASDGSVGTRPAMPAQALPKVLLLQAGSVTTEAILGVALDSHAASSDQLAFDPSDARTYNNATTMQLHGTRGEPIALVVYMRRLTSLFDASLIETRRWQLCFVFNDLRLPAQTIELHFNVLGQLASETPGRSTLDIPALQQPDGSIAEAVHGISLVLEGFSIVDSTFQVFEIRQDGYASGRLSDARIQRDGEIKLTYDNGSTLSAGRLLLADFTADDRLIRRGDSGWTCGDECQSPTLGAPGALGLPGLMPAALNTAF